MVVEPDKVADPVRVGIARDHDVITNIVVVQRLKRPVPVCLGQLLAIPQ